MLQTHPSMQTYPHAVLACFIFLHFPNKIQTLVWILVRNGQRKARHWSPGGARGHFKVSRLSQGVTRGSDRITKVLTRGHMETGKFKQLRLKSEEGHIVVRKGQPRVHQGSVRVHKELQGINQVSPRSYQGPRVTKLSIKDQPGVTTSLSCRGTARRVASLKA